MMKQETIDRIRKLTEDRDWDHPRGRLSTSGDKQPQRSNYPRGRMEGWRDGGRYE